jgi:hypothetical protein
MVVMFLFFEGGRNKIGEGGGDFAIDSKVSGTANWE